MLHAGLLIVVARVPKKAGGADEEENWSVSTDVEAVKRRAADLLPSAAVAAMVGLSVEQKEAVEEPGDVAALTLALKAAAAGPSAAFVAEAEDKGKAFKCSSAEVAGAAFDALFTVSNVVLKNQIRNLAHHIRPVWDSFRTVSLPSCSSLALYRQICLHRCFSASRRRPACPTHLPASS
jgi:hypothetical protein